MSVSLVYFVCYNYTAQSLNTFFPSRTVPQVFKCKLLIVDAPKGIFLILINARAEFKIVLVT